MHYYFDESGNWEEIENEKNVLVIAGVLVKDKQILENLNNDIEKFKKDKNLNELHMTDIKDFSIKDGLYQILDKYIQEQQMKVLGYVLKPKNITETQRDEDELYLDIASRLISEITFGDKDIKIEYDMKFHYAYPQNVIKNMNNILRYDDEFMRMQNKTHIISFKEKQERDRIEKMIRDKKININLNSKEILKKYLWTEFRLKVEKS